MNSYLVVRVSWTMFPLGVHFVEAIDREAAGQLVAVHYKWPLLSVIRIG